MKGSTRTRDESYHVPDDLIPDILSRLPAKSIVRFRAVSKFWYSITTTPDFINSFASRSSPSLLLTFQSHEHDYGDSWDVDIVSYNSKEQCQLVVSCPQNHHHPHGSYDSYHMTNTSKYLKRKESPGPGYFESVHGLVLLPEFVIWNPTTRQFFSLPKPTGKHENTYLGYDPVEGKHKVLHLSEPAQILTLGAQESWREITCRVYGFPNGRTGRCFNGILYYDAYCSGVLDCVIGFDVRSETFNSPIKYPEDYWSRVPEYVSWGNECPLMISYEGTLALVSTRIIPGDDSGYDKVELCILEDADGHKWTRKFLPLPSSVDETEMRFFQGVTAAGELIYTSWRGPSLYILYFDPRKNSIRDSLFEGIRSDKCGCYYDIFPNHIENVFSM